MIRACHALDAAVRRLIGAGDTALDAAALTMRRRPDGTQPTGVVLPLLSPGSVPSWRIAATRATAVVAVVVAFGAVVQWPMASSRTWLFAANLTVAAGFSAGSVLLSDEPRHARTRGALLVASILWSVAWVQVWDYGPLPFIASLIGPVPATLAIWGLLQFPRPWRGRRAAQAVLGLIVAMQVASAAMTFTEDHPSGSWWPRLYTPHAHTLLLAVYNDGGVACAILFAGLFAVRTSRLRGHELRITVPIGVAVFAGGLAISLSDTAAAVGDHGRDLWTFYAWEDLLLVCVPASFILSYILRRVSIEELSGRVDAYDTLPQARDKLRRALRDPTLQILLPGVGDSRWVDADGRRHPDPDEDQDRLVVPVHDDGDNLVAVVSLQPSLARFGDLLTATVQSLVLVLDNARLVAQLRDELALLEQSRTRVEAAVAAERRQIRHRTGAGPLILTESARDQLDHAVAVLAADEQPAPDALIAARATITHAADDIRLLSSGEDPVGLGNGLAEAIQRALAVHDRVRTDVTGMRADPKVEQVAYFVITAAVGNAIKYAGLEAEISVTVTGANGPPNESAVGNPPLGGPAGGFLTIEVQDNGPGGADPAGHGLTLMAERVRSVGGELRITSATEAGTTVHAILPRHFPR
jgi:signal transduction histidine kinase